MGRRIFICSAKALLIMMLLCPAIAQMKSVCEFKDVKVPYDLKNEDVTFEKGKYDFELLKMGNVFYLKIKKKGNPILLMPHGEKVHYGDLFDPDIPQRSKFQIKRNPALKIAYLIFESGSHHPEYPSIKVRFRLDYEE